MKPRQAVEYAGGGAASPAQLRVEIQGDAAAAVAEVQ
jgi:translation initiation factor 1 (eIF-1/SUI1)